MLDIIGKSNHKTELEKCNAEAFNWKYYRLQNSSRIYTSKSIFVQATIKSAFKNTVLIPNFSSGDDSH